MTDDRMMQAAERVIDEILAEARAGGQVTVYITNTYECGRESDREIVVPAPDVDLTDEDQLDAWWDMYVHDETGDGHPCGSRDHAYYEATIVEAPGHDELVGLTMSWEG